MEVKLNKKLHRYLVQNSLVLELNAVKDTPNGVVSPTSCKYVFLTPNHYSLTEADVTSLDAGLTKALKRMEHIPVSFHPVLDALADKDFVKKLKNKGYKCLSVYGRGIKVTLTPLERVI